MKSITNMAEAQTAYDQCMATLSSTHDVLNAAARPPADWATYQAALATCDAAQEAAQAALGVLQSVILDVPAVKDLSGKLAADTEAMKERTKDLAATAASLDAVAGVANNMTAVATALSRFV